MATTFSYFRFAGIKLVDAGTEFKSDSTKRILQLTFVTIRRLDVLRNYPPSEKNTVYPTEKENLKMKMPFGGLQPDQAFPFRPYSPSDRPVSLKQDEPRVEGLWNYNLKSSHRVNKRLPQVSQDLGQPQPQPPRPRLGPVGPTG